MTTYLSQAQEYYQQKIERTDHPCLGGITKGGAVRGYLKSNDSEDFIPFACELTGAGVKGGLYTARSGNTPENTRKYLPFHFSLTGDGCFGLAKADLTEASCEFWLKTTPSGRPVYQYIGGALTPNGLLIAIIISACTTKRVEHSYFSGFFLASTSYTSYGKPSR